MERENVEINTVGRKEDLDKILEKIDSAIKSTNERLMMISVDLRLTSDEVRLHIETKKNVIREKTPMRSRSRYEEDDYQ